MRIPHPRGTILVVTMVALFALASMTLVLCRAARVEAITSANVAGSLQAAAVERGAEQYVLALLQEQQDAVLELAEDDFAAVQVGDGYFWIIRPDYGDESLPAFGLVDEGSKLNINFASADALSRLPEMTTDIAAAIVDWRDEDSNVGPGGAENESYLSLPDPYFCKNAPFETVEELLMVRGVTRELLYGDPALRASRSDQAFDARILDNQQAGRGIYDLLTRSSAPPPAGTTTPINVNDSRQRTRLGEILREKLGASRGDEVLALAQGGFIDIFDFYFRTGLKVSELEQIENDITTSAQPATAARINVNTATRDVLMTLPGVEAADADRLISQRPASSQSIAWVADALERKAIGLGALITARSYQYSAEIVAASGNGRAFKRCRIIVDISGDTPQTVYRRDLTDQGWPMDPTILADLRAGRGPGAWAPLTLAQGASTR